MIFTLRQPNVEATLEEVERARIAIHVEVCHTTLSARGPDGVWERLHPSAVIHAIARPMVTRREEQVAHEPSTTVDLDAAWRVDCARATSC